MPESLKYMSTKQITDELNELDAKWDDFHATCDGMAGSPGEWMTERINELETELRRRGFPIGVCDALAAYREVMK